MKYSYVCPNCGPVEFAIPADFLSCRCGASARRQFAIGVIRSSLKSEARWDPVVGEHVENNRQFDYLLSKGQEAQSEKLNMDVKLQKVDARDSDALASLHGHSAERREHDLEGTRKKAFEDAK